MSHDDLLLRNERLLFAVIHEFIFFVEAHHRLVVFLGQPDIRDPWLVATESTAGREARQQGQIPCIETWP